MSLPTRMTVDTNLHHPGAGNVDNVENKVPTYRQQAQVQHELVEVPRGGGAMVDGGLARHIVRGQPELSPYQTSQLNLFFKSLVEIVPFAIIRAALSLLYTLGIICEPKPSTDASPPPWATQRGPRTGRKIIWTGESRTRSLCMAAASVPKRGTGLTKSG
jgi:hypothetical protein